MNETLKPIYEQYGLTICARKVKQSKEHVCRYAKKRSWITPANNQIADNVLQLLNKVQLK
ncbi:hypothetical protein [Shewanella sp. MBTL60-007]|uniref:hypothetical protein n=1 Tax=Shewanella sp. MBTL60-007 TaxID=2815911 RepID=UPI001BC53B0B|nr:hypothetical protein [Shewanella sp. MBTL60-007]GIU31819.1 hypothetical protein TUM3792_43880 [Shewanella sp. MBTL60-007]